MCTRSDPERSLDIIKRAWSGPLDPAIHPDQKGFNSRLIIDACRPYEWRDQFPPAIGPEPAYKRETREKWGWICGGIHPTASYIRRHEKERAFARSFSCQAGRLMDLLGRKLTGRRPPGLIRGRNGRLRYRRASCQARARVRAVVPGQPGGDELDLHGRADRRCVSRSNATESMLRGFDALMVCLTFVTV